MSEEQLQEQQEVQVDPTETKAREMGWNPEYDGDDKLSAQEYINRKPLYDDIRKLRKKTRDLENALMAQQHMQEQLLEKERKQILNSLKAAKKQAMEDQDLDKLEEIDEQIEEVKTTPVKAPVQAIPEEYETWLEKNTWYEKSIVLQGAADKIGFTLREKHPDWSLKQILDETTRQMKNEFPEKFENKRRTGPPAVESGSASESAGKKDITDGMTKEMKTIAETFWKRGIFGEVTRQEAFKKYMESFNTKFGE